MGGLGVQCVRADQHFGQVQVVEQRGERGDLGGLVGNLARWASTRAGPAEHGCQQVHRAPVAGFGAAQRRAVHGDHVVGG